MDMDTADAQSVAEIEIYKDIIHFLIEKLCEAEFKLQHLEQPRNIWEQPRRGKPQNALLVNLTSLKVRHLVVITMTSLKDMELLELNQFASTDLKAMKPRTRVMQKPAEDK